MVTLVASRIIDCGSEDFLAFVLDVCRYREVDDKIGPIDWVRTDGLVTEFRFRPTLPGLPGAPQTVSRMTLTPGRRIDIAYAPSPANRIVRHLSSFRACFECEPDGERTRVTRSLSLGLPRFLRAVEVPLLRSLLQRSIDRELDLASRRSWPPPPARAVHRDRW